MSETIQYLLFFGLLWGGALGAWLWIRWRLKLDAAAEQAARDAWARVTPREGCTRTTPGCICARESLGEQCVWRRPRHETLNVGGNRLAPTQEQR